MSLRLESQNPIADRHDGSTPITDDSRRQLRGVSLSGRGQWAANSGAGQTGQSSVSALRFTVCVVLFPGAVNNRAMPSEKVRLPRLSENTDS